jgi:hypothetical protein
MHVQPRYIFQELGEWLVTNFNGYIHVHTTYTSSFNAFFPDLIVDVWLSLVFLKALSVNFDASRWRMYYFLVVMIFLGRMLGSVHLGAA